MGAKVDDERAPAGRKTILPERISALNRTCFKIKLL
jgi:hypothetical protein